jgi:hypothetical protein
VGCDSTEFDGSTSRTQGQNLGLLVRSIALPWGCAGRTGRDDQAMTYLDDSANRTLDNANEGIMSNDFDKWWNNYSDTNRYWPSIHPESIAREGWNARQTEIDALKRVIEVRRGIARHLSADVEKFFNENAALKAENERLRNELFKANCGLNANFSNSFEQPYLMPEAPMKDFSTPEEEK